MITEVNGKKLDFYQLLDQSLSANLIIKDRKIIYANKTSLNLLNLSHAEEILGKDYFTFIHPDYYELMERRFQNIIESKVTLEPIELKIITSSGTEIDIESIEGVFFFEGEVLIQVNVQDITDKKETKNMLMQTEKLSVMGELAAGIVHEVRNPLTVLRGFLEMIAETESSKNKEYIEIMKLELERIETIANDLLLFSKPHPQKVKINNMRKLFSEVIFLLEPMAFKKHIGLKLHCMDESIEMMSDATQLKQAFINMIKNAIEATPLYGEVNISVRKNNNSIDVDISDTGCGIPIGQLNKIGTSFFSTKQDGTGLGLMVTFNIIKNHNGIINITSEVGKGTTFAIKFTY